MQGLDSLLWILSDCIFIARLFRKLARDATKLLVLVKRASVMVHMKNMYINIVKIKSFNTSFDIVDDSI